MFVTNDYAGNFGKHKSGFSNKSQLPQTQEPYSVFYMQLYMHDDAN
jgi:hypothetical protein